MKWRTQKLIEDNITENLDDLGFGDEVLDAIPKSHMKDIINKLDILKLKT